MDTSRSDPDLSLVARRLSAEIGPFRRALLTTARRTGALPEIPDAQIEVLRRLDEDGWSSPTRIGRALGLARSTVSNLVAVMQRDGLVDRRLAAGDGRSTEVGLTDLARERLSVYDAAAEQVLVAALQTLDAQARHDLARALPGFADLRQVLESGEPPRP